MYTGTIVKKNVEFLINGVNGMTQKEIAAILGVSRATVARALKGDANIKPETKKRVLDLCEEVGYKKNYISSVLANKNQRKKNIYAFLVRSKNENYLNGIMEGLEILREEIAKYNVNLEFIVTDIDRPEEQVLKVKTVLKYSDVDGIIIIPLLQGEIEKAVEEYPEVHVVTLDKKINDRISFIGSDYKSSGRIVGGIFTKLSGEGDRIIVLDSEEDKISSKDYLEGFLEQLNMSDAGRVQVSYIEDLNNNLDEIGNIEGIRDAQYIYTTRHVCKVASFLKDIELEGIKIIANGIDRDTIDLIKEDRIVVATKENYFLQGYLAGKVVFNKLSGDKTYIDYKTKSEVVFKENIGQIEANHEKDIFKNFNIL